MTLVIAAAMLVMGSCQRKPVMAHARFVHLPTDGWQRTLPLTFRPEYDDSAATYDITLAVRYDNSYRYRNLTMAVDVITADSAVNRRTVDMALADEYGNWTGGGFEARSIVVWQSMGVCDTLRGLVNLGIITTTATKK